jgi:nucleolar pre-ribosomal-associated protein 1
VNFKADRLWILQLLYAGSNLADDATICKRGSVLELFLAFCSSAVSDSESKRLILQVRLNFSLAYVFEYRMCMMMH